MKTTVVIIGIVLVSILSIDVYHVDENASKYGVVKIKGYTHGVALCDAEEHDTPVDTHVGEYHKWVENNIMYTIDYGHMDDDEIVILKAFAFQECSK